MYSNRYHTEDISKFKFLITGGAGFIGSNLVEYLIKYNAGHVRVLDNLSNGYFKNIEKFLKYPNFEFINGDIRDFKTCENVLKGVDYVSHQAALGSVPRSIQDPITTNQVNIDGFLNILNAVKDNAKIKRLVYAASSSTYGDSIILPKVEGTEGKPLSPYAVTKLVNELYADVFSKVYKLHTIGLRYFNVFGPNQSPNNPYAAVIPIFCKAVINNITPIIYGDGHTSRDFTFVENAVQANIKAMLITSLEKHEVMNMACGDQITLNEVVSLLSKISGKNIKTQYITEREGDIKHSKANIEKISKYLDFNPAIKFKEGLEIVYKWYNQNGV